MASQPLLLLLLWLGLCLSTGIEALFFRAPGPEVRLRPNGVLPLGHAITISCYTPLKADYFRFYNEDLSSLDELGEEIPAIYPGHECHLYHPALRMEHAGRYRCAYRLGDVWSFNSPLVNIVLMNIYSPPLLTLTPTVVKVGGTVRLQCQPVEHQFVYWLVFKGKISDIDLKNYVAYKIALELDVELKDLQPSHSGVYTCFAFNQSNQRLWTEPSNSVMLTVGELSKRGGGGRGGASEPPAHTSPSLPTEELAPRLSPRVHLASAALALIPLQIQWP
ncbi:platelet glycoprotein VI-like [Dromiciops gliroides]|uniref:platelet glycoprotein VI-like n=1 Tax=Dromiciops gliroides TaxID=33562 RepID=UPI001CC7516B|nr:platelet glycoprotein VI-like [Dromiciops gliroides]